MYYLLILLTGILAILGTLTKTHREVEVNGIKYRKVTSFGVVTVILISVLTVSTFIKQYYDSKNTQIKDAFRINDKIMGPKYYIMISFKDSLLQYDSIANKTQSQVAWKRFLSTVPNAKKESEYEARELMKYFYTHSFLDTSSRKTLFGNSISAKLWFDIGMFKGIVAFWNSGMVFTFFNVDEQIELLQNQDIESNNIAIGWLKNTRTDLLIYGLLPSALSTANFNDKVIQDIISKQKSMHFEILFDKRPDNIVLETINNAINKINNLKFIYACDNVSDNVLVVPLKVKDTYDVEFHKNYWRMTKQVVYQRPPVFSSLSKELKSPVIQIQ